jgi:hypothetical protein
VDVEVGLEVTGLAEGKMTGAAATGADVEGTFMGFDVGVMDAGIFVGGRVAKLPEGEVEEGLEVAGLPEGEVEEEFEVAGLPEGAATGAAVCVLLVVGIFVGGKDGEMTGAAVTGADVEGIRVVGVALVGFVDVGMALLGALVVGPTVETVGTLVTGLLVTGFDVEGKKVGSNDRDTEGVREEGIVGLLLVGAVDEGILLGFAKK